MRTDDLIRTLAENAGPVKPLASAPARTLAWCAVAAACIAAGVMAFGIRSNFADASRQSGFLWITGLAAATAGLFAHRALVLSIPGAASSPVLRLVAGGSVTAWAAALAWATVGANGSVAAPDSHWPACASRIAAIGLGPALTLIAMIRRAAPLRRRSTGALALTGAMAVGALAIQAICPIDDASHALRGHLAPVLLSGVIGALTAGRLLKP